MKNPDLELVDLGLYHSIEFSGDTALVYTENIFGISGSDVVESVIVKDKTTINYKLLDSTTIFTYSFGPNCIRTSMGIIMYTNDEGDALALRLKGEDVLTPDDSELARGIYGMCFDAQHLIKAKALTKRHSDDK